ncbi:hypothetical protein P0F02_003336 [Vibrio metschnikovii]|nr:hypothetical protein [Vibrio metschnikovii]
MEDIKSKGIEGELAFKNWLDESGLSYLYIDQSTDTFASLFKLSVKRPDFLMLLESIGMLAVDVKNYNLSGGVFTLGMTDEFQKALSFERLFRIPLWYVYKHGKTWYWISALKAIEVGEIRKNVKTNKDFLAISIDNFEKINKGDDLGLLYTHRLPKVKEITNVPIDKESENLERAFYGWERHYDFSSSYTYGRIKKIIEAWSKDIRFNIVYRRGEDDYFSTKEGRCSNNVIALIDYINVQLMYEADSFSSPITIFGTHSSNQVAYSVDHLIYAVSSVFYDDKSGSSYTIYFDEDKLTELGRDIVNQFRQKSFLAEVSIGPDPDENLTEEELYMSGYALFADIGER